MSEVKYTFSLQDMVSGKLVNLTATADKAVAKVDKLDSAISSLGKGVALVGGASAMFAFAKNVAYTTAKFQSMGNSIKFASDSAAHGEVSLQWIRDMSEKYGLPIEDLTTGFKTFQGALMDTKFSGEEARKMFAQVNTGVVAMGLSGEDAKGTYLALGQIMSKGKVQAEELRGQIGERIPGAFKIAARAMGMTTAELDKFMSDGKLMAEDFLPKFAAEMEKTFGEGASKSMDTLNTSIVRAENSWTNFMTALGNSQGLIKATTDMFAQSLDFAAKSVMGESGLTKAAGTRVATKGISVIEGSFKQQAELMKASGMDKNAIYEQLQKEATFKIAEIDASLARNNKALPGLEERRNRLAYGLQNEQVNETYQKISALIDKAKTANEANLLLKEALGAIPDKIVARSFMKPNTPVEKVKKDKDSERVRGVKHIVINIGKLVETVNVSVADLQTMGFKIKELVSKELLTAVNDVNVVAGR